MSEYRIQIRILQLEVYTITDSNEAFSFADMQKSLIDLPSPKVYSKCGVWIDELAKIFNIELEDRLSYLQLI